MVASGNHAKQQDLQPKFADLFLYFIKINLLVSILANYNYPCVKLLPHQHFLVKIRMRDYKVQKGIKVRG
jgi:hypothetical protein